MMQRDSAITQLLLRVLALDTPVVWRHSRMILTACGQVPLPELSWLYREIDGSMWLPLEDAELTEHRVVLHGPVRECDWPALLASIITIRVYRADSGVIDDDGQLTESARRTVVRGMFAFCATFSIDPYLVDRYLDPWMVDTDGGPCLWRDLTQKEKNALSMRP